MGSGCDLDGEALWLSFLLLPSWLECIHSRGEEL